ncbi:hypothetical protein [Azospirillum sp. TSO35-2]|uniref:hypothetical protein n=1 Tax=Azospirillum sp. TSO35-2 TaxID=716796 RepID=UPI000D60E2F1|nr:hypothetical protein [Azospirillum sp. TSO35-2]PWC39034.1 hypothetical protein TSO352_01995 [Azospirillum sp. TSO35-2]
MEIRGVSSTTVFRPTSSGATDSASDALAAGGSTADGSTAGAAEKASSGGGYVSPLLRYDQSARVAVLYFRDFDTGETQDQIPSRRVVEEYRRAAGRLASDSVAKSGDGANDRSGTAGAGTGSGSRTDAVTTVTAAAAAAVAGTSFAATGGYSGTSSGGSTSGVGTGTGSSTATTGGGFTPAATGGGSYGASTGGLVSVTV